jgi:hypothetical protein
MEDLYLVALGGDVLLATIVFNNYLSDHSSPAVIGGAFGACLVANFLFMNGTPVEMTAHAAIATAFAWALAPWLQETYLYLKNFLPK